MPSIAALWPILWPKNGGFGGNRRASAVALRRRNPRCHARPKAPVDELVERPPHPASVAPEQVPIDPQGGLGIPVSHLAHHVSGGGSGLEKERDERMTQRVGRHARWEGRSSDGLAQVVCSSHCRSGNPRANVVLGTP